MASLTGAQAYSFLETSNSHTSLGSPALIDTLGLPPCALLSIHDVLLQPFALALSAGVSPCQLMTRGFEPSSKSLRHASS
mmetsp:Transcript_5364/g.12549  ORF Transcript_5364/g.12549 Transcript_5364/m.12549 type:complete len:80 (+) Transcript_5364:905-1144(+)